MDILTTNSHHHLYKVIIWEINIEVYSTNPTRKQSTQLKQHDLENNIANG